VSKKINPAVLPVLKDSLTRAFWYKKDLRGFLSACLAGSEVIGHLDWNDYKRNIIERLIDAMVASQHRYLDQLINLMLSLADITDPYWLKRVEDGQTKYDEAVQSLRRLRAQTEPYRKLRTQQDEADRQARLKSAETAARRAVEKEIEGLRTLLQSITMQPPQERGYSLERLLNQLFQVLDITSRQPFRTHGEQIDGAFSLDRQEFLVEAKWTNAKIGLSDLDTFSGKIGRKLDNTLGLFISMNGFEETAVQSYSQRRSTIILMDGADLYAVLEGRIELPDLLDRKRRHAAQTGVVFLPVSEILVSSR